MVRGVKEHNRRLRCCVTPESVEAMIGIKRLESAQTQHRIALAQSNGAAMKVQQLVVPLCLRLPRKGAATARVMSAGHAEFVLNLFSEIIEKAGVTLVIAGTPAIEAVIDKNVRNLRKLNSGGESRFLQMKLGDPEFNAFCDAYWDYQYVKKPKALSNTIRTAWYRAGAGNPAFTALVFMLAQRTEIGGRECIDEVSFERASKHDMSILGPAISALRSRDPQALLEFDDLLFTDGGQSLMDMIRRPQEAEEVIDDGEEFDEIASGEPAGAKGKAASKATPAKKPKAAASAEIKLPVENPLIRH